MLTGWNAATRLKNSNDESPVGVCGKYVTSVFLGHEMIETSAIPAIIAPLTRYIIRYAVNIPPQKIPTHRVGFSSLPLSHTPVTAFLNSGLQPASSTGVATDPVIAPIPAE